MTKTSEEFDKQIAEVWKLNAEWSKFEARTSLHRAALDFIGDIPYLDDTTIMCRSGAITGASDLLGREYYSNEKRIDG